MVFWDYPYLTNHFYPGTIDYKKIFSFYLSLLYLSMEQVCNLLNSKFLIIPLFNCILYIVSLDIGTSSWACDVLWHICIYSSYIQTQAPLDNPAVCMANHTLNFSS